MKYFNKCIVITFIRNITMSLSLSLLITTVDLSNNVLSHQVTWCHMMDYQPSQWASFVPDDASRDEHKSKQGIRFNTGSRSCHWSNDRRSFSKNIHFVHTNYDLRGGVKDVFVVDHRRNNCPNPLKFFFLNLAVSLSLTPMYHGSVCTMGPQIPKALSMK